MAGATKPHFLRGQEALREHARCEQLPRGFWLPWDVGVAGCGIRAVLAIEPAQMADEVRRGAAAAAAGEATEPSEEEEMEEVVEEEEDDDDE